MSSSFLETFVPLFAVSILWGCTNPFIKKGSSGLEKIRERSFLLQISREIIFLASNVKYMLPFLINQCGSLLYLVTLAKTDISLAVPVTNSLTFMLTALMGWSMGEELPNKKTVFGMILIVTGITICCYDRI